MAKKYNCEKNGIPYFRKSAMINGKQQDFYGDGEKDADRKIDAAKKKYENAISQSANVEFRAGLRQYLYEVKIYTIKKPATMARYDTVFRHLPKSNLDGKAVGIITKRDAEYFISEMVELGKTHSQIKETTKVIKMYFNYLVDSDIILRNPFSKVKPPQSIVPINFEEANTPMMPSFIEVDDVDCRLENDFVSNYQVQANNKIEIFNSEEELAIIAESENTINGFLLELDFNSGMRLGEICAVSYQDFRDGGVWVSKNYQRIALIKPDQSREIKSLILDPKSTSGIRFIPLPIEMFDKLEKHRREQIKRLGFITNRVFTTDSGRYLEQANLYRMYRRVLKRSGIERRKFHTIRHTFITNCIESGMDLVTVQKIAGHSSIQQTMEYTHVREEHKRTEITKLYDYKNEKNVSEKNQHGKHMGKE